MDSDLLWHSLGGGAILTAIVTAAVGLVRLLLDYRTRATERRLDDAQRRTTQEHDAEARLERILQDRLADADRRFDRCDAELHAALRELPCDEAPQRLPS